MWVNASTWISLFMSVCAYAFVCVCVFVQNNPDYTHFSVSHFRKKGGEGRRRKRVREREWKRDVLPPRQTPFKWTTESDQWFPLGVGCIGRPAAQTEFRSGNNWEHQLSLQEDYTPWVENGLFHHAYLLRFTVFISSVLVSFSCSLFVGHACM